MDAEQCAAEHERRMTSSLRRRRPWRGRVLLAAALAVVATPATAVQPHCNDFLSFCQWNASTSSCVFAQSVAFTCGPTLLPIESEAGASGLGSSDGEQGEVGVPPSALDWGCRWNVAGDLSLAPGVEVRVDSDDCLLQISAGKMVFVQQDAVLHASSVSIEASFVRVGPRASVVASFAGKYRKVHGLFSGSAIYGASNGGSGGQRLVLNSTMLTKETTRGYFDVRSRTADINALSSGVADAGDNTSAEAVENKRLQLLHDASGSWQIAQFWAAELASLNNLIPPEDVGSNRDPSVRSARFLLGSGSSGVVTFSNGTTAAVSTRGGGRIKIAASKDVVVMDSAIISANGDDAVEGVSGGSGGSVLIAAAALSMSGSVQARGGSAFCASDAEKRGVARCFPAGGGGRVQISYISSQLEIDAVDTAGGTLKAAQVTEALENRLAPAQIAALSGASGTYYQVVRRADGKHESQLVVKDNRHHCSHIDCGGDSSRPSVAGAVTTVLVEKKHPSVDLFSAMDGAIVSTSVLEMDDGDITIMNGSLIVDSLEMFVSSTPGKLTIHAQDISVKDRSSVILPSSIMKLISRSFSMDATTLLRFEYSCHIQTVQALHLDSNITSTLDVSESASGIVGTSKLLALESDGEVILSGNTVVGGLWVSSAQSVTVTGKVDAQNSASIKSTFRRCHLQDWKYLEYDPLSPTFANFTILIHALDSIYLGHRNKLQERTATLHGGAVLLCATDSIKVSSSSIVSSNGKGELANQGPGSGTCVSSIGGGAGYGGRGADSSAVSLKGDYASGGLSYGTRSGVGMLGSGGGCVSGGNGGGVVMLGASGLTLDGEIHCNGDGGTNGAGGGSGGFLGLSIAQYLRGEGRISAVGGGSECTEEVVTIVRQTQAAVESAKKSEVRSISNVQPRLCGGGGGGGRVQLIGCELSDFDECTRGFEGNYTVAGGATSAGAINTDDPTADAPPKAAVAAASSGTFFGFPCPPGSGGLFCRICPVGTYKVESNSEECLPCANAPTNAHYVGHGSISAECDWTCDPGYTGYYCVSPLQQLLDACGGEIGFALVLLSIMTFFILLGYACRNRKESYTIRVSKGERQHLLSRAVSQRSRFRTLLRCFYWPRVRYPKLLERDLPEHMARLYLSGTNDSDSPLRLRTTVPPSLKQVLYDDEFKDLAEQINDAMAWGSGPCSSWGRLLRAIVKLLCYPFSSTVTLYLRHTRVNSLKRLVSKYNHACMKGPRARWLLNAVKLGYCSDYSLVYLELLHKESSQSVCVPTTKIGKPSVPMVLLFAGSGSYFSPFYLDPSDLLVRAIPQCPELTAFIDEPWVEFVAELNELLRVVHRDAIIETLIPVAKYLEKKMAATSGTGVCGRFGGLRIYLGRFYVQDDAEIGEEFKLGIFLTTASAESAASDNTGPSRYYGNYGKESSHYGGTGMYGRDIYGPPDLDFGHRNGGAVSGFGAMDALPYDTSLWHHNSARLGRRGSNNNVLGPVQGGANGSSDSTTASGNGKAGSSVAFSRIREEALRVRTSTAGSIDTLPHGNGRSSGDDSTGLTTRARKKQQRRRTYYEGWQGPVDASLPVPGVLISADELEDRLADQTQRRVIEAFMQFHLLPRNVPRSSSLNLLWMLSISLLSLLMVDLAITFAMVVNLKCVTDGEVDEDCSATILVPVLLIPPFALIVSPIMGIVSLALSSSTFTRRYSVWNALSMISVGIAIIACMARSSRLLAPWFAGPVPLLPMIALGVKAGQGYLVERYIAFQETQRRRRGWRGLMKRRLSDASIPPDSP